MSPKRPVRCAVYTRKSTEEGLEQDFNSLDAQHEACDAYIVSQRSEGWTVSKERYDDGGYSGGTLQRPALQRLLRDIEHGAVDVVVVYKIDRLSRSLMDFSKLVEVFDRKSVTFVSVTQSFNTTTSMGRLTLNMLLSFAQFEREITGERIRDKFAASKRKGIWMGGNPPLGYDVSNRKLVVNVAEADTVRLIFKRYLELGCARLLCAELLAMGVVSKRRRFATGQLRGGKPIGRSAIYCILNNRTYIGETAHKGASYKGEHASLVPRELFDVIKQRLADLGPSLSGRARQLQDAPYTGRLFDETGAAMLPTYSVKKGGLRYRYYASRPTLKGERSRAAIHRIPAPPFETFMSATFVRVGICGTEASDQAPAIVQRISVLSNSIVIHLDRAEALAHWRSVSPEGEKQRDRDIIDQRRAALGDGEVLKDDGVRFTLTLPVRASFRGGASLVEQAPGSDQRKPDTALLKAIARAHRWRQMLQDGEVASIDALAARIGQDRGHVGLTLNLAFLSPAVTRSIVRGEQPPGLRLSHLLSADIPPAWSEQPAALKRMVARPHR